MKIENEAINILVSEISKFTKTLISKAPFDRTRKGRIVSNLGNKYYEVQLGSDLYKAYSPILTYNENDIVYVKIIENRYDSLIIECLAK